MDHRNIKRPAPRPLSIYLGAAMAMIQPDASENHIAAHQMQVSRMLHGIRKYQEHDYQRPRTGAPILWQGGEASLSFFQAGGKKHGALLLVPSMVNGSEILDLLPEKSFAQWMASQGFDIYLLDWGAAPADAGLQDLDEGVLPRLLAAADYVRLRTGAAVDALGYCMGGTLLLAAAARQENLFNRLILLSAPWDFHAGNPAMAGQVMAGAGMAMQLLEEKTALPVDWIQNLFAQVNPSVAIHKFSAFLDMPPDSGEERVFIAVEDWLNGGQDLPRGVARSCILDWYGANKPGKGEWVALEKLGDCPILVVAAAKDILVPPESALAVKDKLAKAHLLEPPCGHIGLMAGKEAQSMVWEPVRDWLL